MSRAKETRPGAVQNLKFWASVRVRDPDEWAPIIKATSYSEGIKKWAASVIWFAYFRPSIGGELSDMVETCPKITLLEETELFHLLHELNIDLQPIK